MKPTYNVESGTLPGLYLGCANKLSIVSPGLGPLWQPSFSGDGGDVIPEGGKGKVTIIPNAAAFTLNISNNGSLIGKENFKVRTVPRPELRLYVNGAEADEKRGISAGQARTVEVKCFSDEKETQLHKWQSVRRHYAKPSHGTLRCMCRMPCHCRHISIVVSRDCDKGKSTPTSS